MSQRGLDLKIELVKIIRRDYRTLNRQVKVFTADPRFKREMPCVAVNRIYDSEDKMGFDNFYNQELTPDGSGTVENKSGLFTQNCEVRIWTENADERDDMFNELKEILLLAKDDLGKFGFGEMMIKGGRDENDFRTYSPLFIYWAVINFTALSPFDAFRTPDTTATKIQKVDTSYALDGAEQKKEDLV